MRTAEVLSIYYKLTDGQHTDILSVPFKRKSTTSENSGIRPNSYSVEDAFFGDSGKGAVVAKLNEMFARNGRLYSMRYNGGSNAGHEADINGKKIVTHQIPMAVVKEGATAFIPRGMRLHPEDALTEIDEIQKALGASKLPGNLIIDHNTPLALDTHRAFETLLNETTSGGRGSTGRGIAPAHIDIFLRTAMTLRNLMREDWEKELREHYRLYQKITIGFGDLKDIEVYTMGQKEKRMVGPENEFIDRLRETRIGLKGYVASNVFDLLTEAWKNDQDTLFTIEGAQGAGLDPFHGVYPDVSAGRPMSRNLNDPTYNVILPEEIEWRTAAMKTTYMSSVGKRRLPIKRTDAYNEYEKRVQEEFDERGKSTGRLRDIYPVSIPIAQYLRRGAGYEYLVATHLDASKKGEKFEVVVGYEDKVTGKETPYSPYQEDLDNLTPVTVEFDGWDGEAIKKIRDPKDLPPETRVYLGFLGRTIAPVAFGTTGPELGSYISWLPDL
jgi:adenylosuccinate synthase